MSTYLLHALFKEGDNINLARFFFYKIGFCYNIALKSKCFSEKEKNTVTCTDVASLI